MVEDLSLHVRSGIGSIDPTFTVKGGTLHLNRHSTLTISVTDYGKVRV